MRGKKLHHRDEIKALTGCTESQIRMIVSLTPRDSRSLPIGEVTRQHVALRQLRQTAYSLSHYGVRFVRFWGLFLKGVFKSGDSVQKLPDIFLILLNQSDRF
jgi:hypothetical protein